MKMGENMFKFHTKNEGIISSLLTQISLFIVSGILFASIVGIAFYNDWTKEAEIKNIAIDLSSEIYSVDLQEFFIHESYKIPPKNFSYDIYLSPYYITISRHDGRLKKDITFHKKLLIHPIISCSNEWKSAKELKNFLKEKYNCYGNKSSPLNKDAKKYLEGIVNNINLSISPYKIDINKPIFLDKLVLYFYDGMVKEYVVVYQR